MFVQTEFVAASGVLLATRRHREPGEPPLWAAHRSVLEGEAVGGLQFETDRARFLGPRAANCATPYPSWKRGRCPTPRAPYSILSSRCAGGCASDREKPFGWPSGHCSPPTVLERWRRPTSIAMRPPSSGVKRLAAARALDRLHRFSTSVDEASLFQEIAGRVLYSDASLRAGREALAGNVLGPSTLWAFGISGDLPIVVVRIDDERHLGGVQQLLRAFEYWRQKYLIVDLVIVNEAPAPESSLQLAIDSAIATFRSGNTDGAAASRGKIFSLRGASMAAADSRLLDVAARAVFVAARGSLREQLARAREPVPMQGAAATTDASRIPLADVAAPRPTLDYFNGLGGPSAPTRLLSTISTGLAASPPVAANTSPCSTRANIPPAPWVNVVANPHFGFMVSADGAGSTWSLNARENQLTPWSNDRSSICLRRQSTSATTRAANCGAQRRCPSGSRPARIPCITASVTAASNTPRTPSRWIWCSSCRCRTRSRSRA